MAMFKTILGVILCIVGVLFVLFEIAMLIGETHSFLTGGWIPFSIFVVLGLAIFVGGILLWRG
jgi:hypothetical protein